MAPLPGRYSGVFEVLADGEPCALRVRRQAGETGWVIEGPNGFIAVTSAAETETAVLAYEAERITAAVEELDAWLEEVST